MILNSLADYRARKGWSQQELATRSGLSRTEISAIERGRVVPSTSASLSLARVFGCSVEQIFSLPGVAQESTRWAWTPSQQRGRFWQARIGSKTLLFPTEWTLAGTLGHDGVYGEDGIQLTRPTDPGRTLVIAGCDPAVGLLAARIQMVSNLRVIPLTRSSRRAIEMLGQGLVHAAGLHFSAGRTGTGNQVTAEAFLKRDFHLLRVARWEEGVAVTPSLKASSLGALLASGVRWVGRQEGSAARQCQDEILGRLRPDGCHYQAHHHHGVAETICSGWAQAGVCVRLAAEERGLHFLRVREEDYDLCFPGETETEPTIQALLNAVRSTPYREDLERLPGYDSGDTGELQSCMPQAGAPGPTGP